ncbi:uncharacterized protein [Lolium perenne]|uniref:uncharacterized protein isoform X2 n=1 Tax=Lolium perenne TaxID=4522 RepID=UPI0021F5AE18|nr:uncharacterized protein LOC127302031 isoform X2 [Lolium perenne]
MGLRDLVMGRSVCAAPGSSSSSSNPISSFVDAFLGHSPELKKELSTTAVLLKTSSDLFKDVRLSTVPGNENEIELDQKSPRSIKDFVNGHHGYTCGENFKTSILAVPEVSGSDPHFQESAQIGPPEMDVHHRLHQSPFEQYDVLMQPKECLQELVNRSMLYTDVVYGNEMGWPRKIRHPQMVYCGRISEFEQAQSAEDQIDRTEITNMVVLAQSDTHEQTSAHDDYSKCQGLGMTSVDEFSGGWLSFLGIALSHLAGLSQPRFFDEPIKWYEQVIGRRVWIKIEGLQQRSGWSVIVEATRKTLFDALQDAAMLAVVTMRIHFPLEFRGTPFTVLPMEPGQRSKLDYPAIGGGAEAATFMGINYDDLATLQWQRFASLHRERWESDEAFEEKILQKLQSLEVAGKMLKGLPPTREIDQRIADILKMYNKVEDPLVAGDCGWSVSVSNKMQKAESLQVPSDQEEIPAASSPTVSVRSRL